MDSTLIVCGICFVGLGLFCIYLSAKIDRAIKKADLAMKTILELKYR